MNLENEQETIDFLKQCSEVYYNSGDLLLSDDEYDRLYEMAQNAFPDNPFFQGIGAPVRGSEIQHTTQIGGLEQVHKGELDKWKTRSGYSDEDMLVSEKLDGSSLTLKYVKGKLSTGYTRGDGVSGQDVTRHVRNMPSVPKTIDCQEEEIRGEFIAKKENFEIIKEILLRVSGREYKNLRGIVNGLINSKEIPEEIFPYLDFVAYGVRTQENTQKRNFEWLKSQGFLTPHYIILSSFNIDENHLNEVLNIMRRDSLYEIDGIVVEYNEYSKRQALGFHESSRNPKYGFKWKTRSADNLAQAVCTGVEWNMSRTLYWKPTVLIEATDLCGITVQRLSGFNAKFIKEKGIGPGAVIEFTRAGDVIPHILDVPTSVEWSQPPGNWVWTDTGIDAVSLDDSEDAQLEKLKYFFNSLDVECLQEATLSKLMADGYDGVLDIIDLPRDYWSTKIGRNGEKAYDSLHTKLQNVYLWELIGSWPYFGRGMGKRRAQQIVGALGEDCINATVEQLVAIPGFSEKTAKVFLAGLDDFVKAVNWMFERKYTKFRKDDIIEPIVGILTGKKFVFTGYRSKEAEERIVELGGEVQSGIKKDTTYLVVKDRSKTSNKIKQAEESDVIILEPSQLEELLR